jgi:hypothetical protein
MFKIGDFVSFFSLDEEFEHVSNTEQFIKDAAYYEIAEIIEGDVLRVHTQGRERLIPVIMDEYMIHTKESLREHLKSKNCSHAAICNKVKQLYRKHNNSNSSFKFQGV